ncbi:MAG TPA: rhodanese-like domain-containing protein, partial [Flavobacteriales bacterium]|nr:rhodanese-like domain-containing protein [Flavobacteriales bacterium]
MALLLACGGEHEAVDTVVMADSTVVRKELPAALLAAEDLYALQIGERPPLLIDVRPAEEYAQGHIP